SLRFALGPIRNLHSADRSVELRIPQCRKCRTSSSSKSVRVVKYLMMNITVKCLRCGHEWTPRIDRRPRQCPNCHQAKWDVPAWAGKVGKSGESLSVDRSVDREYDFGA